MGAAYLDVEQDAQSGCDEPGAESSPPTASRQTEPGIGIRPGRWAAAAAATLLLVGAAAWAVAPRGAPRRSHRAGAGATEVLVEENVRMRAAEGLAAAGQNVGPGAAPIVYDCSTGIKWLKSWAPERKDYCCKDVGVGCESGDYKWWVIIGVAFVSLTLAATVCLVMKKREEDRKRMLVNFPATFSSKPGKERCCTCFVARGN